MSEMFLLEVEHIRVVVLSQLDGFLKVSVTIVKDYRRYKNKRVRTKQIFVIIVVIA